MNLKEQITALLSEHDTNSVEKYAGYCQRLSTETKREGGLKSPWMSKMSAEQLAVFFKRVEDDGLVFDGKHITLQSTGIFYDFVAYKNKMLQAYPETKLDMAVIHEGDKFDVSRENGKINYSHKIADPLASDDKITGAYAVIINKRGEFITTLNKEDLEKHRKVAKTDFIWRQWYREMVFKTVLRKACKYHFEDEFEKMNETDNEHYELEAQGLTIEQKTVIDAIETIEELKKYYDKNKGQGKELDMYVSKRKKELQNATS